MTELAPLHAHADFQLAAASASTSYAPAAATKTNGYSPPAEQLVEDEDNSTIRCLCDISDDDGNTVLCEICNTWQHILCYYPGGNETVPDEHFCVICKPRPYDKKAAQDRQINARVLVSPQERKIKKVPSKSHKKKVKDINSAAIQTNGWLSGNDAPDRASGSPRDGGPPAKRPKTAHRSSASTSNFAAAGSAHSRKRAGSTTLNGQSPTKSPRSHSPEGYTGDYYSPEFMRISNAPFTLVEDNSYASINVSNDLRTWLSDADALSEVHPGLHQVDVFTRWDRPIEALKQLSPGVSSCKREDPSMLINGTRPVHRWVEASTSCAKESYIGELNGLIGRTEDYYADPNNRWSELRHPEPFVFFHERLPIFVDCREEGSVLRHVGRSCQPNVKLQIIIHGTDFHFCFISLREIAAGEELTVPWHLRDRELELVRTVNEGGSLRPEDEAYISSYFTNVLANFGGCACSRLGPGVTCNLARFDLRNKERASYTNNGNNNTTTTKTKPRKPKRLPAQISPGSTGRATNSRAGSEAVILQGDNDEEMADSRSLSAKSSRSQPSSRDITPMVDAAVGLGVGMSDRERRKLMQQEKLFEKMEMDGQGGRKGKRHSAGAGSALNTPVPSSSKQLGFPENTSPTATTLAFNRPRTNGSTPRPTNGTRVARPKPEMVSMPTQTDNDATMASPSPPRRRTTGSHVSCLLRRVQQESRRRKERSTSVLSLEGGKPSPSPSNAAPVFATKMEGTPSPVLTSMPPPPVPTVVGGEQSRPDPATEGAAVDAESKDIDMQDAPESVPTLPTAEAMDSESTVLDTQPELPAEGTSDTKTEPPAPPWPPTTDSQPAPTPPPAELASKPSQIPIPPVPTFPSTDSNNIAFPPSGSAPAPLPQATSAELVQSPAATPALTPSASVSNPPLLSPSISHTSITAPSPAKKKMSLGDWMRQKKEKEAVAKQAKDKEAEEVRSDPIEEGEEDAEGEVEREKERGVAVEDVDMPLVPVAVVTEERAEEEVDEDADAEGEEDGEVTERVAPVPAAAPSATFVADGKDAVKTEDEKKEEKENLPDVPPPTAPSTS